MEHLNYTFIVLSPDADTMYLSSKSTTLTAALCPTSTLLRFISVGDCISHTAMERSFKRKTFMFERYVQYVHVGKIYIQAHHASVISSFCSI